MKRKIMEVNSDSDDEIFEYSSLRRTRKKAKHVGRAAPNTMYKGRDSPIIAHPNPAEMTDTSNVRPTTSACMTHILETQASHIDTGPKSPAKDMKSLWKTGSKDSECYDYCPFCQMPLFILRCQSPRSHVMECMDVPILAVKECEMGICCISSEASHYRDFLHSALARRRAGEFNSSPMGCTSNTSTAHGKIRKSSQKRSLSTRKKETCDTNSSPYFKKSSPGGRLLLGSKAKKAKRNLFTQNNVDESVTQARTNYIVQQEKLKGACSSDGNTTDDFDVSSTPLTKAKEQDYSSSGSESDIFDACDKTSSKHNCDLVDDSESKDKNHLSIQKGDSDNTEKKDSFVSDQHSETISDIIEGTESSSLSSQNSDVIVCDISENKNSSIIPKKSTLCGVTETKDKAETPKNKPVANEDVSSLLEDLKDEFDTEISDCEITLVVPSPMKTPSKLKPTQSVTSPHNRTHNPAGKTNKKTVQHSSGRLQRNTKQLQKQDKSQTSLLSFFSCQQKKQKHKQGDESVPNDSQTSSNASGVSDNTSSTRSNSSISRNVSSISNSSGKNAWLLMRQATSKANFITTTGNTGSTRNTRKGSTDTNYDQQPDSSDTSTGRYQRQCPFYKKLPGTPFTVDAFRYGSIPGCRAYFLSHFHYDHYAGLTRKFMHPIYCSKITANLVIRKIRVNARYVHAIPMNTTTVVEGVEVTLLEANHCPGSALLLYKLPDGRVYLHTGDFRAHTDMESYPELQGITVDQLYLDTTYCDPSYAFPAQQDVIDLAVSLATEAVYQNPNTLVVCGTYTIGKERIFMAIAEALNCKIAVTKEKKDTLDCLEDANLDRRLTQQWKDARVHVLPMNKLNFSSLAAHLATLKCRYNSVLAFEPTGWTHSNKTLCLADIRPKLDREGITLYGVPYSEHSSYTEMKRFVKYLRPRKILPTVNNGNPSSRRKMEALFKSWLAEAEASPRKVTRQSVLNSWVKKSSQD